MDIGKERLLHFIVFLCFMLIYICYEKNKENEKLKDMVYEAEKTIGIQNQVIINQKHYIEAINKFIN